MIPTAPPSPISRSMAAVKPGPFAAGSFGIGCDVDTMRRPAAPRARRQSGRRSICSRRAPSLRPLSAEHDGRTYLDLADKDWRAVGIGPDGWRGVAAAPVRFRRAAGMLPLPIPQRGGSIEGLAALLNIPAPDEFVLVVAWLVAALQRGGPYPLLVIAGEQGSAKTVLTKFLRALIDPNVAPTRAPPREERDLMIAANNGHILAFDNLSGLPS